MDNPGGAAIIGGVMMMNGDRVAAAVRLPDGRVHVATLAPPAAAGWMATARRLPVARGLAALAASLSASVTALLWSARVGGATDAELARLGSGRSARYASLAFAGLLSLVPFWVMHAVLGAIGGGRVAAGVTEAALRLGFLVGYVWAVGRWHRIAEVFAYHGAEHKTISCYEYGDPLVPVVIAGHSRFHPRCGTAFAFWAVMVISVVGAAAGDLGPVGGAAVRLGALALAVGFGYEIVRASARAGTTASARALRAPGMLLQHLTTRDPDLGQIETAVAALRGCATDAQRAAIDAAIADWQASHSAPAA